MMLGQPESLVPKIFNMACRFHAATDSGARRFTGSHGNQIQNRKSDKTHSSWMSYAPEKSRPIFRLEFLTNGKYPSTLGDLNEAAGAGPEERVGRMND
jgi:hypothetical protein